MFTVGDIVTMSEIGRTTHEASSSNPHYMTGEITTIAPFNFANIQEEVYYIHVKWLNGRENNGYVYGTLLTQKLIRITNFKI